MMPQHQHCRDGRHDGNNATSSRRRVASANLPNSSDSNSTPVSTNENKISQRRPPRRSGRADLECRRSATLTQRRHSSPGPRKEATSSTSQQPPSGAGGNEAAIRHRRKCQPLHRCASMNESVSSILKPSKYSPSSSITSEGGGDNNTAAIAATAATTDKKPSSRKFLRRWSAPESLPAASMHSFFLPPLEKPLNKTQKRPSSDELDKWVADGVDFCNSVEVHVFRS